jgi:pyruvate dehydrogenase E1 component
VQDPNLSILERIQRRVLWLATWMVHHANNLRPNPDGTKVGGHQASSASSVSLLTALYFHHLRQGDVVALKAHAAPAFYAIQYLLGRLSADDLRELRTFGRLQAYPSRRKNPEIVDLSTGSMGLGAVQATFGAFAARYLADHGAPGGPDRFIVMVGDAELDEGNVWEALLEEPLAALGTVRWIVDMNRQSLDRVVPDSRRRQLRGMFGAAGWRVIECRWGGRLSAALRAPAATPWRGGSRPCRTRSTTRSFACPRRRRARRWSPAPTARPRRRSSARSGGVPTTRSRRSWAISAATTWGRSSRRTRRPTASATGPR